MSSRSNRVVTVALFWIGGFIGAVVLALIISRVLGLLVPYSIPTSGMDPTIKRGDYLTTQGFTYLLRKPARGDLIVFRTAGIKGIGRDEIYMQRLVGLPGDRLEIIGGKLLVNGEPVSFYTPAGDPVRYANVALLSVGHDYVVPQGTYFALGDNSANSFDSRYWGPIPAANITGRVWFKY